MSVRHIEGEIFRSARKVFNNSKIRLKDIMEWSTGTIEPHEGEVVAKVPLLFGDLHVNVAIKAELDKRPKKED